MLKTVYFWISEFNRSRTLTNDGATVFLDAQGIILIDYLEKGQTITGEYYAILLSLLHKKTANGTSEIVAQKILFYQDNAPPHTSAVLIEKVYKLRFKLLPHLPYSPDLAPSGFFLFPNLKVWLGEKRFSSDKELIAVVDGYFKGFETSYFSEGTKELEERCTKCVEVEGDYLEK